MTTTVRNLMMSVTLAGSLLLAMPVSAQMSNHRRPSGNNGASMTTRSESRHARPESHSIRSNNSNSRSAQSMNNDRPRPNAVESTRQGAVDKDNRGNNNNDRGGNYNRNDRGNNGNTGNDRGGNYNRNDRGNNGNDRGGNYNRNDRGRDNRGNYSHNDRRHYDNHGNRGHNAYRDHYSWNHAHNDWSRPLPPPARAYRPAPYRCYRPHVPHGYRPRYGAPVIDRILGITFGTMFNVSLNYLYTNGYTIDGYDNGVVYLRSVNMLNLNWPDVMLCYDDYGRLINAQFIHSSYYNDRSRYNRLYNDLCVAYGAPIEIEAGGVTWFGGNTTGYVTLSLSQSGSRFYTNLYVGN